MQEQVEVTFYMSDRPGAFDEHGGLASDTGLWRARIVAPTPLTRQEIESLAAAGPVDQVRARWWGRDRWREEMVGVCTISNGGRVLTVVAHRRGWERLRYTTAESQLRTTPNSNSSQICFFVLGFIC